MKKKQIIARTGWLSLVSAIVLSLGLAADPVISADSIDPDADKILKSMSSYLAETEAFSVNADIDVEFVTRDGQKLQLSSFATVILQRPNKFHIQRQGTIADVEFIFDGKTLTLYGKKSNVYAQMMPQEPLITPSVPTNWRPVSPRLAPICCLPIPMPSSRLGLRMVPISAPPM